MLVINSFDNAANLLLEGKIGVLPTDTIYGLSCLANRIDLINRVYKLKGRDAHKPFITLISQIPSNFPFVVHNYWPGPVSIIVDGKSYRCPNYPKLIDLISATGPIISTSCNPTGFPPAQNIPAAQNYFGENVDFYLDVGALTNPPSKVIEIQNDGSEKIIRD